MYNVWRENKYKTSDANPEPKITYEWKDNIKLEGQFEGPEAKIMKHNL